MAIYEIDVKNFHKLDALLSKLNSVFTGLRKVDKVLDDVGESGSKLSQDGKTYTDLKKVSGVLTEIGKKESTLGDSTNYSMLDVALDNLIEKEKQLGQMTNLEKMDETLGSIVNNEKKLKDGNKAFSELNTQLNKINKNILGMFGFEEIIGHFDKIKGTGSSMWKSMTAGAGGFLKTIGVIFIKFKAILLIVGLLTTVIKMFKTLFKFNIGGLQTTFRKLGAQFKQFQVIMQMQLFKQLQKLAPLFKTIGEGLEEIFKILTSDEILNAFSVIVDVLSNVLKLILPAIISIVKVLANWIKYLASLINTVAGFFNSGSSSNNSTTNNTNNYDNKTINYYSAGNYNMSSDILSQLNFRGI